MTCFACHRRCISPIRVRSSWSHQQATKTWVACPVSLSGVRVLLLLCSPIVRIRCPALVARSQPAPLDRERALFPGGWSTARLVAGPSCLPYRPSGRAAGRGRCGGVRPGSSGDCAAMPRPRPDKPRPHATTPQQKNHPRIFSKPGTERKSVRAAVGAPPSNWGKCFSGLFGRGGKM